MQREPIERRRSRVVGQPARQTTAPATVASQHVRSLRVAPRSPELVRAVRQIDVHSDERFRREAMAWIQKCYDDRGGGPLLGLFGRCYLGAPYVDHVMDSSGSILQHFTPAQPVPNGFEPARPLVRSDAYAYIEVYADGQIIPVREDGTSGV